MMIPTSLLCNTIIDTPDFILTSSSIISNLRGFHSQTMHNICYISAIAKLSAVCLSDSPEQILASLHADVKILTALCKICYLQAQPPVPKAGNLHLAWQFAQDPAHHYKSQ
ncbi:hypothetical protein C8J56DRAFT_1048336 [Mycena floridula]|nr:hypothetical protein C8J56DRAFT_1048336 [Mycena floridula]